MTSNVRAVFAQILGVPLKVGCYLNRLGEGVFGAQSEIGNGSSKIGCYLIRCYLISQRCTAYSDGLRQYFFLRTFFTLARSKGQPEIALTTRRSGVRSFVLGKAASHLGALC
jgi:hypothetical protein